MKNKNLVLALLTETIAISSSFVLAPENPIEVFEDFTLDGVSNPTCTVLNLTCSNEGQMVCLVRVFDVSSSSFRNTVAYKYESGCSDVLKHPVVIVPSSTIFVQ